MGSSYDKNTDFKKYYPFFYYYLPITKASKIGWLCFFFCVWAIPWDYLYQYSFYRTGVEFVSDYIPAISNVSANATNPEWTYAFMTFIYALGIMGLVFSIILARPLKPWLNGEVKRKRWLFIVMVLAVLLVGFVLFDLSIPEDRSVLSGRRNIGNWLYDPLKTQIALTFMWYVFVMMFYITISIFYSIIVLLGFVVLKK